MMRFNSVVINVFAFYVLISTTAQAAEWKLEPSVSLRTLYNDNVSMRTEEDIPVSSTGYSIDPQIRFAAEEQSLWDLSLSTRGKLTRYKDRPDADSDNVYVNFDSGRQTERMMLRLSASFTRNTNFDDEYDTESPDAGLLDDKSESDTILVSPSVSWSMSESSYVTLRLNSTDVKYDEVSTFSQSDYVTDNSILNITWDVAQNHRLGFTGSYADYANQEARYFYDQTVFQLDYTYTLNQVSNFKISVGARNTDILRKNILTGCDAYASNDLTTSLGVVPIENFPSGTCPLSSTFITIFRVFEDVEETDDGTTFDISYASDSESSGHKFSLGMNVSPSGISGAQIERNVSYKFIKSNTEKFTTNLLVDISETEALSNVYSSNDRVRYRIEPSFSYKLNRDWGVSFKYSYIAQNISDSDQDSISNSIYINLSLNWPKLATTY